MISDIVLASWIEGLNFERLSDGKYQRNLSNGLAVLIDAKRGSISYPDGINVASRTTSNLSQLENLVVLDCVIRLLEDNYPPSSITLEPTWKVGRGASGGRADILVRDRLGSSYLLIECKTAGGEYNNEWNKTTAGTGQLFSYAQQETGVRFLVLYTSEPRDGEVVTQYQIISHFDDELVLAKEDDLPAFRTATTADDRFNAWTTTYHQFSSSSGLFSGRRTPYQVGQMPRTTNDLIDLTESDRTRKAGDFATILRKYNISGRENAFDVLVNLFLAKLTDELDNPEDLQFTWRGSTIETPYDLAERLEVLYRTGMKNFLDEDVAYIESKDLDHAMRFITSSPDAAKAEIAELFKKQKFYSKSNFGLLDVHNEELFLLNSAVLIEMVDMWQKSKLSVAGNRASTQALGDMFEIFLDEGIKQNEGQYFTPWPVCDFIIDCIPEPETKEPPRILDFACGAGHFLTQYYNKRIAQIENEEARKKATSNLYGIEKEYRLSKVSKVASAMYGALQSNIYYEDALAQSTFSNSNLAEPFDILLSNPPYSVDGFLTQLDERSRESLDLTSVIANPLKFDQIEDAFLQKAAEVVNPGGYVALIFPESFYDKYSASSNLTRDKLFSSFELKALVKLPTGSFSSTGTSTWISFLRRREEGPSAAEHIAARVEAIFSQGSDAINDPAYDDSRIVEMYCSKFGLTYAGFIALLNRDLEFSFEQEEAFTGEITSRINSLRADNHVSVDETSDEEIREEILPGFLEEMIIDHKDRLRKFWLLNSNGRCLLVTPDDSIGTNQKVATKYLGYKWSKRRGHEGLHLVEPESERLAAPLFPSESNVLSAAIRTTLDVSDSSDLDEEELQKKLSGLAKIDYRDGIDIVSWPSQGSPLAIDLSPVVDISAKSPYPVEEIGNVIDIRYGASLPEHLRNPNGDVTVFGSKGPVGFHNEARFTEPGVIVGRKGSAGLASLSLGPSFPIDTAYFVRPRNDKKISVEFLYLIIDHHRFPAGGSGVPSLPITRFKRYQVPIPPMKKQLEIVETVFNKEGSDRDDPVSVNAKKDGMFREKYLQNELGW